MNKKLQIFLSGAGLMGQQHARLIQANPDCELAAIVGPPTEHNQAFSKSIGAKLFNSIPDALAHVKEIDAAIISSPNEHHFDQAMSCIAQAIPVLVEKPVTDTLGTARLLAAESDRQNIPVLVGHHRTYSPLLDAAATFIQSPEFGRLVAMQGSALFYKPAHYFAEGPWRTRLGGGPVLINLIHEIGVIRNLCGEIKCVSAMAGNNIRNFEVEDTVAISFQFESGALGTFLLSDTAASNKSWEMTSGENPTYPHFPEHNCYHFAGTNGSLDFPTLHARYYESGTTPSWWSPFKNKQLSIFQVDPLERQLEHFVRVVRNLDTPRVSARDGYRNMLIVDAIARSIATRAMVQLEEEGTTG